MTSIFPRAWRGTLILTLAASILASCADEQFGITTTSPDSSDGMAFALTVTEQADLNIGIGSTRAASDSIAASATRFVAHPLEGDNPDGLSVHRMPLPFMGIHPGTIPASAASARSAGSDNDAASPTRAPLSELATTSDFHDSLTIWGYTDRGRTLFSQVTLKRIRNWRSSVHWPYDTERPSYYPATGDGAWQKSWENPQYMRFFALSPSMEDMEIMITNVPGRYADTEGSEKTWHAPSFTYTLPDAVAEQRDLLFGVSPEIDIQAGPRGTGPRENDLGNDDKTVNLQFQHILTAIRFAKGTIPSHLTITKIGLHNINNTGTFSYDTTTGTIDWSDLKGSETYEITSLSNYSEEGSSNIYIDGRQVMFMIPHKLSSKAELEVMLIDTQNDNRQHVLKCTIGSDDDSGDVWRPGYTVTYKITIGEVEDDYYLFAESPAPHEHSDKALPYEGKGQPFFTIQSYRQYTDYSDGTGTVIKETDATHTQDKYSAAWELVGLSNTANGPFKELTEWQEEDDELHNKTNWITAIDKSGSGGLNQQVKYSLSAQSYTRSGNHADILETNSKAAVKASHIDLSKYTPNHKTGDPNGEQLNNGKRLAANCYIVNRQGTYGFPMIYGYVHNDVKKTIFYDHTGQVIFAGWICKQLTDQEHQVPKPTYKNDNDEIVNESEATKKTWTGYDFTDYNCFKAEVVWQDVNGLIKDADLGVNMEAKGYQGNGEEEKADANERGLVTFTVSQSQPGNAVIALKGRKKTTTYTSKTDSGKDDEGNIIYNWSTETNTSYPDDYEIIWTWHIWMTDEIYTNDGSNNENLIDENFLTYDSDTKSKIVTLKDKDGNETNKILPVNLGWVPDDPNFGFYSPRKVYVKIKQTASGKEAVVTIQQHARQPRVTGTSTLYQWGRPTAFPSIDGNKRTIYDGSGKDITSQFTIQDVSSNYLPAAIQNPTKMLRHGSGDAGNWWDSSAGVPSFTFSDKKNYYWGSSVKTIHDPCPPGFQVPAGSVFSVASLTGGNISNTNSGTNLNIWENTKNDLGVNMKNAEIKEGAWGYQKAHDGSIPQDERYSSMVYFPATGYWSGFSCDYESTLFNWTSDADADQKKGINWRLRPQKGSTSDGTFDYFLSDERMPFSTAMPIRPVKSK